MKKAPSFVKYQIKYLHCVYKKHIYLFFFNLSKIEILSILRSPVGKFSVLNEAANKAHAKLTFVAENSKAEKREQE